MTGDTTSDMDQRHGCKLGCGREIDKPAEPNLRLANLLGKQNGHRDLIPL
jgi:hypothetical protein